MNLFLLITLSIVIFSISMVLYSYCRIYIIRGERIEIQEKIIKLKDEKISDMDRCIKSLSDELEIPNAIRSYGKS